MFEEVTEDIWSLYDPQVRWPYLARMTHIRFYRKRIFDHKPKTESISMHHSNIHMCCNTCMLL